MGCISLRLCAVMCTAPLACVPAVQVVHPCSPAAPRRRKASRAVPEWRETIAAVTPGVEHFTSSFMHAVPFSPMQ